MTLFCLFQFLVLDQINNFKIQIFISCRNFIINLASARLYIYVFSNFLADSCLLSASAHERYSKQ